MDPDLSDLDTYLSEAGADGYLMNAADDDPNPGYISGFSAPDPFTTLYTPGGVRLLVSGLEYGRATKESRAASVRRGSDYDYREKVEELGRTAAGHAVVAEFLREFDVGSVAVPERFPVALADALRERGIGVEAETDDVLTGIRAVKTDEEVEYLRAAQAANERAMAAAEDLIREATVDEDGTLVHDGDPLTSERVKEEIEVTLLREGCGLDEAIVACGADGADPHDRGSGPLEAGELVVIDIFPKKRATGYHGDLTRTFLKGEPTDEMRERYRITDEALAAALDTLRAGTTGEAVHDAVCDVYEEAGYATLRDDPAAETGFIHSTGHGVGLEVHELPRLSPDGGELEPGHVVTVEPGLYDPAVGGVRIEDLVVVTEDGYENLTDYPKELVVD